MPTRAGVQQQVLGMTRGLPGHHPAVLVLACPFSAFLGFGSVVSTQSSAARSGCVSAVLSLQLGHGLSPEGMRRPEEGLRAPILKCSVFFLRTLAFAARAISGGIALCALNVSYAHPRRGAATMLGMTRGLPGHQC